jgi:hypothetical protein
MARCWALGAAVRWARGECDEEELRTAAATVDCYFTVSGALVAAYSAAATAYAAHTAHYGVLVTYFVFAANADLTAKPRALAQCADIVRRWCPYHPSSQENAK